MNIVSRVAKNTGLMLLSKGISYIFGFLYVIYAARYLGAASFGLLSFAIAFTGIFEVFIDLGLNSLSTREIARDKSLTKKYLGNITVIKIILSLINFIIIAFLVNILQYPLQTVQIVYILTAYLILFNFSAMFFSIFQAYEKMEYQSLGQILFSLILIFSVYLSIILDLNILGFALSYLFASLITLIYSIGVCVLKFTKPGFNINFDFWKSSIKLSLPISMFTFFSLIAFRVDTVLLSLLQGDSAVGYYTAAYKLMEATMILPAVFTAAIYPVFSNLYLSSKKSLKDSYKLSIKYITILGLPIAIGTTLLANQLILLIYNTSYVESVIALQILIWTTPIVFITYICTTLLISINKQNLLLKITFLGMIFNIFLNLILIPRYSFVGASIVTVMTEAIYLVFYIYYLSKFIGKLKLQTILKTVLAGTLMGIFIFYIKINLFLLIILSALLYFLILIALRTFNERDYAIFKKIIR